MNLEEMQGRTVLLASLAMACGLLACLVAFKLAGWWAVGMVVLLDLSRQYSVKVMMMLALMEAAKAVEEIED